MSESATLPPAASRYRSAEALTGSLTILMVLFLGFSPYMWIALFLLLGVDPDVGPIVPLGFSEEGVLSYSHFQSSFDIRVADVDWERGDFTGEAAPLSDRFVGTNSSATWSPDGSRRPIFLGAPVRECRAHRISWSSRSRMEPSATSSSRCG